jgi:hypothetical protein
MKAIPVLALTVSFFTQLPAHACPIVNGVFAKAGDADSGYEFSSKSEGGAFFYKTGDTPLLKADGKEITQKNPEDGKDYRLSASCSGDNFSIQIKSDGSEFSLKVIAKSNSRLAIEAKQDGQLVAEASGIHEKK